MSEESKRGRLVVACGEYHDFLVSQLFNWILLPLTCHILPPLASMNYKTHAPCHALPQHQSNHPKKEQVNWLLQWWVLHFLSGQLSSWNLPPLTCYLMQPSPSLDYKPHNPCHTLLWAQSNNDNNKIIAGLIAIPVVSITIFTWSTIYLEMALPDLISSSTSPSPWITNILPHAAPSHGFNLATKIWSMTNGY